MEIDETRDKNKRKEEVQTQSEEKVGRDVHRETDGGREPIIITLVLNFELHAEMKIGMQITEPCSY